MITFLYFGRKGVWGVQALAVSELRQSPLFKLLLKYSVITFGTFGRSNI